MLWTQPQASRDVQALDQTQPHLQLKDRVHVASLCRLKKQPPEPAHQPGVVQRGPQSAAPDHRVQEHLPRHQGDEDHEDTRQQQRNSSDGDEDCHEKERADDHDPSQQEETRTVQRPARSREKTKHRKY